MQQVKCHFCQANNTEGTHKCQSCFKWLAGLQLRYAGWKSWPRRPMECSPWIRSTSRSNQEVNGFLIVPELTNDGLEEVILGISKMPHRPMQVAMGRWATPRFKTEWNETHITPSIMRQPRSPRTAVSS